MTHSSLYILENQSRLLKLLNNNEGFHLPLFVTLVMLQNALFSHPKTLMPTLTQFNIDTDVFSEASLTVRQAVDDGKLDLLYATAPLFVAQDLEKVISLMRSPDSSFDNKPEDIESIIHAFKTLDYSSERIHEQVRRLDQFTRSFLSDATWFYLNEITNKS